jgi:hypothetical protein
MTTFGASLTTRTVFLPESRDSNRHVSVSTHLPLLRLVAWRYFSLLAADVSSSAEGPASLQAPPPLILQTLT